MRPRVKPSSEPAYRLGAPACQLLKLLRAETCRHYEQAADRFLATAVSFDRCYFLFWPAGGRTPAYFPDLQFAGSSRRRYRDGARNDAWYRNHPPNPGTTIIRHSDHLSTTALVTSPFYKQALRPIGMLHGLTLIFWTSSFLTGCLTLLRAGPHGDFRAREVETLQAIHRVILGDSVQRLTLLYRLKAERTALGQAIYAHPQSVAVVRSNGEIVAASQQARRVVRAWNGNGTLTHKLHHGPIELPDQLRDWCTKSPPPATQPHPKWTATVVPLSTPDHRRDGHYRLLIFQTRIPEHEISARELTHTEVDLVGHLCTGRTNREIARLRGTSRYTVKCQISALLQKFGCKNRTALAVLFAHARNGIRNGRHLN